MANNFEKCEVKIYSPPSPFGTRFPEREPEIKFIQTYLTASDAGVAKIFGEGSTDHSSAALFLLLLLHFFDGNLLTCISSTPQDRVGPQWLKELRRLLTGVS